MSVLDKLRPGQQGVLALLLRRGQSYQELAGTLDTSAPVVTGMARSAVRSIAPPAAGVEPASLDRLADYVLGQLPASEAEEVAGELERSPAARRWVRDAVSALGPLYEAVTPPPMPTKDERNGSPPAAAVTDRAPDARESAPAAIRDDPAVDSGRDPADARDRRRKEITAERPESERADLLDGAEGSEPERAPRSRLARAEPARRSRLARAEPIRPVAEADQERSRTSSTSKARRRFVVLLGALALVLATVGLWASSRDERPAPGEASSTAPGRPERARIERQVALEPSRGETGAGIIAVSRGGGGRQLVVQARLRPSRPGERYELWLYRSKTAARSLGARPTDARGNYRAAVPLPADYASYPAIDLSRENDPQPSHSGDSVLRAALGPP